MAKPTPRATEPFERQQSEHRRNTLTLSGANSGAPSHSAVCNKQIKPHQDIHRFALRRQRSVYVRKLSSRNDRRHLTE